MLCFCCCGGVGVCAVPPSSNNDDRPPSAGGIKTSHIDHKSHLLVATICRNTPQAVVLVCTRVVLWDKTLMLEGPLALVGNKPAPHVLGAPTIFAMLFDHTHYHDYVAAVGIVGVDGHIPAVHTLGCMCGWGSCIS